MRKNIEKKVQLYLGQQAIFKDKKTVNLNANKIKILNTEIIGEKYKDKKTTDNIFVGRNLPSFVKDYLIKRYAKGEEVDRASLTCFLDKVMPTDNIRMKLADGQEITLLTRFNVSVNLIKDELHFGIVDLGIKDNEGIIPKYLAAQHKEDFRKH